jgi:GT2 family glycosyltransferase/SAM-dependent methyltransferase
MPTTRPACPVCGAAGNLFHDFGARRLLLCEDCRTLFYDSLLEKAAHNSSSPWESPKWYAQRGANLLFYAEVIQYIGQLGETRPGPIRMLEIGGGFGFLMDMAETLFGWSTEGVEPQPAGVSGSQELNLKIHSSTLEESALNKPFDVIVSVQVLEHLRDIGTHLRAMADLLTEDGLMIFTTPDSDSEDLGAEYDPTNHNIILSSGGFDKALKQAGLTPYQYLKGKTHLARIAVAGTSGKRAGLARPLNSVTSESARLATLDYLGQRTRSENLGPNAALGLSFRLFELLVNEGRYREALEMAPKLEKRMGREPGESSESFLTRTFSALSEARSSEEYLESGPSCFPLYILYRGMLSLNHDSDPSAAAGQFGHAARLFSKEVEQYDLIQFKPWISVAESHEEIALSRAPMKPPAFRVDYGEDMTPAAVAPFMERGASELAECVPAGRLRWISVKGKGAFHFSFTCTTDVLVGLAVNTRFKWKKDAHGGEFKLRLYEEYNPVALRETVKTLSREQTSLNDPFLFEPVPDSYGHRFNVVLEIPGSVKAAWLQCGQNANVTTVAEYVRHKSTQPVLVPYHAGRIPTESAVLSRETPLVSVLIVTYNSQGHIRGCLDSVFNQSYPRFHVVVVDNNSQDGTAEIVREFYPEVQLVELEENTGYCKANNRGLAYCKGELIHVLNPDTVLNADAMSRMVYHGSLSPWIAIVGTGIDTRGSMHRYSDAFLDGGTVAHRPEHLQKAFRFAAVPCGASFLIRRSVIDDVGGLFDERFTANWEDHDLGLRCWLRGYFCMHLSEVHVYHDGGGSFGFAEPTRDVQVIRNSLLTYFKVFGRWSFLRAFCITAWNCRRPHKLIGLLQFFRFLRTFLPSRRALQERRVVNDSFLHAIASGFHGVVFPDVDDEGNEHVRH